MNIAPQDSSPATVLPYRATVAELGNDLVLVSVSGELDLYVEPKLRASLAAAEDRGCTSVVVDLSGVSFLDSTICGSLIREARRRRAANGRLVVVANGSLATRALGLAGIDRVVPLFPTLHDAMESLLEVSPR
jgi:anti-sigma B factor antagonist